MRIQLAAVLTPEQNAAVSGPPWLPHGYLVHEKARYEEGPEGFVAVDRNGSEEVRPVVGWGRDRAEAHLAADRSGNARSTILIYPCTGKLRVAISKGPAKCKVSGIDVAYEATETTPDAKVFGWFNEHVCPAHGETLDGGMDEWDALLPSVDVVARAYLLGHPTVGIAEDGRLGWTDKAKLREVPDDIGIAPLSHVQDGEEIRENLPEADAPDSAIRRSEEESGL